MPDNNELVIKISGDVGDYKAALQLAGEQTKELSEGLEKVAKYAAVAFAALSVEVYESVAAFHEHVTATNELTNALENQGLPAAELSKKYREIAEAISQKTGIDADQITSAQASGQALLGEIEITDKLTKAVVNFAAAKKIGMNEAFTLVAKSVSSEINILQRYGISLDGAITSTEKLERITTALSTRYDGAAEQAANAAGSTAKLKVAFDEMQKAIGERLAPAFDAIVKSLTTFFNYVTQHAEVANFAADVIFAGTAVTGLTIALTLGAQAYLTLRTAAIAAGLATEATTVAIRVAAGATGIGLLIVVASEVYQHWGVIWPAAQKIFETFTHNIAQSALAVGKILLGTFTLDPGLVKQGIDQTLALYKEAGEKIKSQGGAGGEQYGPTAEDAKRLAAKKKAADEEKAIIAEYDEIKLAKRQAQNELLALEDARASKDTIEMKKQEIQLLTEAENKKNAALLDALNKRLQMVRRLEEDQAVVEKQRNTELSDDLLARNRAYQSMSLDQRKVFLEKNEASLKDGLLTEHDAKEAAAKQELDLDKKNYNTFLIEQQKYGTAMATINRLMHSQIYEGTKSAFADMAEFQKSSNSILKAIGKEAAVANIIIKTAETAMNLLESFSTIPYVGWALGIAAASAATAYGAEQVATVQSAAHGGLLEGGIPGVDSIPVLAMAGEVVAPRQNFEEVVGSVAASRAAKDSGLMPGDGGGGLSHPEVLATLKSISQKLDNQNKGGEVHIHGDALGDNVWLDHLMRKIGEAFEFRHARVPGINVGIA